MQNVEFQVLSAPTEVSHEPPSEITQDILTGFLNDQARKGWETISVFHLAEDCWVVTKRTNPPE